MSRLIRTTPALQTACEGLARASELAVDTEFHSERHYYPELMLIQVRADEEEPLIIDVLADLDLTPLANVLASARIVLHGGQTDAQVLGRSLGIRLNVCFDTQIAAGCVGDGFPLRLQEITRRHLDRHIPKGETLSDWSQRPLTPLQLGYAADDVLILAPLKRALVTALEARGNTLLADQLLQEQLDLALRPENDDEAWRSLAGAQVLEPPDRAIAREVARWRQSEARRRDVPRHSILSDAILLDVSRRAPDSIEAMKANRRMPSNVWKREGNSIIECVQRGRTATPPGPLHPRPRAWMDLVRAAARVAEARTGVALELLLPDREINAIAEGRKPTGWRQFALGPDFFSFLEGTSSISMPDAWRIREEN